jgi:hypothetical protein
MKTASEAVYAVYGLQKRCGRTFIPLAGFEPMIQVFQLAWAFYALDLAATVILIGFPLLIFYYILKYS